MAAWKLLGNEFQVLQCVQEALGAAEDDGALVVRSAGDERERVLLGRRCDPPPDNCKATSSKRKLCIRLSQ